MILLHDRATMARALTLDLEPRLKSLLAARIAGLSTGPDDLTDATEFLVVEPGDTEADIVREIGLSPLVEPFDGVRFGEPGFEPHFDLLADRGGWFELMLTFGSTFALFLLIADADGVPPDLRAFCRTYAA